MNNELVNKIIKESIDRLVDEAKLIDPSEMWANMEGGTNRNKRKRPGEPVTPRPRQRVTSLYDAKTANQIGRTIRNAWDSVKLSAINGFNRNAVKIFGIRNANALWDFFNDNGHDMFTQFRMKYNEVDKLTKDIEAWGKKGYTADVSYRLRDLPKPLEELADLTTKLYERCQQLKKLAKMNDVPLPGGMKPSVINGYLTSNGLSNLIVYSGRQKAIGEITGKLRECAEYIRSKWGDNLAHGSNDDGYNKDAGNTMIGGKVYSGKL